MLQHRRGPAHHIPAVSCREDTQMLPAPHNFWDFPSQKSLPPSRIFPLPQLPGDSLPFLTRPVPSLGRRILSWLGCQVNTFL